MYLTRFLYETCPPQVHEKEHQNTYFRYVRATHTSPCVDDDGQPFDAWSNEGLLDIAKCRSMCDVQHSCHGIRFKASESKSKSGQSACTLLVHKSATLTTAGPFHSWKKLPPTKAKMDTKSCYKRVRSSTMPESMHGLLLFSCTSPHTVGMFKNTWRYWYDTGGTVSTGDGKRAAYDKLEVQTLTFVVVRAWWIKSRPFCNVNSDVSCTRKPKNRGVLSMAPRKCSHAQNEAAAWNPPIRRSSTRILG